MLPDSLVPCKVTQSVTGSGKLGDGHNSAHHNSLAIVNKITIKKKKRNKVSLLLPTLAVRKASERAVSSFTEESRHSCWVHANISLLLHSCVLPISEKSSESLSVAGLPTAAVTPLENRAQVTSVPEPSWDEAICELPYASVGSG